MKARGGDLDRWTMRARATLRWSGAIALTIGIGCSRHRQVDTEASAAVTAQHTQTAPVLAPASPAPSGNSPAWPTAYVPTAPAREAPMQPAEQPAEAETKKPRNFRAELEGMLGDLGSCVQPRAPNEAGTISIDVTAHVMPGGAVPHSDVNASSLQPEELACVRIRAEAVHFAPPIENAPFTVQASLQVTPKVRATEKPDAPRADSMGMVITQAPSGEGISPGIVPPPDPGIVPPPDPGVIPTPDPPALAIPEMPALGSP